MGNCNSCYTFLERTASLFPPNSRPVMVTQEHFADTLRDSSSYWVYARFSDHKFLSPCFYALDINENKYVRLPDHPMITYLDNASSVFDHNLYVIRRRKTGPSRVYWFDPVLHKWSDTIDIPLSRRGRAREAVAASVNGNVYVFGGHEVQIAEWGQVYEPSTKRWAAIPGSQVVADALNSGLAPLRASAVLGNKIIVRGPRKGIAFDVMSNSWTPVSENLINGWWKCIRAAVVQNMLITCHVEYVQQEIHQLSIGAYDPDKDVWLLLEGIDRSFHKNAHRCQFMSVNGKLVIYHMWKKNDLRYSVFQLNEKFRGTVRVNLVLQSRISISKMVKQGLNTGPEHPKSVDKYEECLLVALNADGS